MTFVPDSGASPEEAGSPPVTSSRAEDGTPPTVRRGRVYSFFEHLSDAVIEHSPVERTMMRTVDVGGVERPAIATHAPSRIRYRSVTVHAGARLAVDSTVATPVLTQPIKLGADIVVHSATKYLNGHCDVVAGAVVTAKKDEFWQSICELRTDNGAILGSLEAFLLQRGMRTLFLRIHRACESALTLAKHFEGHAGVEAVIYPGLPSHPGHELAKRQMNGGFGGMLCIQVKGGADEALRVVKRCNVFIRATSFGGVESLIEHRYTIEGEGSPVPRDWLRLSVGIESVQDLIADLEQALE